METNAAPGVFYIRFASHKRKEASKRRKEGGLLRLQVWHFLYPPGPKEAKDQRMKSNSLYLGSVHISLSTINSSLSI